MLRALRLALVPGHVHLSRGEDQSDGQESGHVLAPSVFDSFLLQNANPTNSRGTLLSVIWGNIIFLPLQWPLLSQTHFYFHVTKKTSPLFLLVAENGSSS
jgi:hypothetical protein